MVQSEVTLKNIRYVSDLVSHMNRTWVGFETNLICHIQTVIKCRMQAQEVQKLKD